MELTLKVTSTDLCPDMFQCLGSQHHVAVHLGLILNFERYGKDANVLWDRFKRTTDTADYEVYRTCRNECTKLKRTKRSKYEEGSAESAVFAPKRLFSYLRRRTKVSNGIPPLVDPQSHLLMEDDFDKARDSAKTVLLCLCRSSSPNEPRHRQATPNQLNNIVFSVSMIEKQLRI